MCHSQILLQRSNLKVVSYSEDEEVREANAISAVTPQRRAGNCRLRWRLQRVLKHQSHYYHLPTYFENIENWRIYWWFTNIEKLRKLGRCPDHVIMVVLVSKRLIENFFKQKSLRFGVHRSWA